MQIDDNTDTNSIGFRLMLDRGIMPTEETLDLACKYLHNQDIHLIIERKILPTKINFQSYISHNPYISNSRPCVQQYTYAIPIVDNINVDKHHLNHSSVLPTRNQYSEELFFLHRYYMPSE